MLEGWEVVGSGDAVGSWRFGGLADEIMVGTGTPGRLIRREFKSLKHQPTTTTTETRRLDAATLHNSWISRVAH